MACGLLLKALFTAALGLSAASCWQASRLAPPDVSEAGRAISERAERQRLIVEVMERDIARLERLAQEIVSEGVSSYDSPFPLQTFRLTAVACLNEPLVLQREEAEGALKLPGTPLDEAATRFGVSCRPESLLQLERRLEALGGEQGTRSRALAMEQLERIESARQLRHTLRERQAKLARYVLEARDEVAEMRSQWRVVAQQVDARKLDYELSRWRATRDELAAQREALDELDAQLDALEQVLPFWPARVARLLDELLYELAWLGLS